MLGLLHAQPSLFGRKPKSCGTLVAHFPADAESFRSDRLAVHSRLSPCSAEVEVWGYPISASLFLHLVFFFVVDLSLLLNSSRWLLIAGRLTCEFL